MSNGNSNETGASKRDSKNDSQASGAAKSRRSQHNFAEQQRRMRFNEIMEELRSIVPDVSGDGPNLRSIHKVDVLLATIAYVNQLQQTNCLLLNENRRYRRDYQILIMRLNSMIASQQPQQPQSQPKSQPQQGQGQEQQKSEILASNNLSSRSKRPSSEGENSGNGSRSAKRDKPTYTKFSPTLVAPTPAPVIPTPASTPAPALPVLSGFIMAQPYLPPSTDTSSQFAVAYSPPNSPPPPGSPYSPSFSPAAAGQILPDPSSPCLSPVMGMNATSSAGVVNILPNGFPILPSFSPSRGPIPLAPSPSPPSGSMGGGRTTYPHMYSITPRSSRSFAKAPTSLQQPSAQNKILQPTPIAPRPSTTSDKSSNIPALTTTTLPPPLSPIMTPPPHSSETPREIAIASSPLIDDDLFKLDVLEDTSESRTTTLKAGASSTPSTATRTTRTTKRTRRFNVVLEDESDLEEEEDERAFRQFVHPPPSASTTTSTVNPSEQIHLQKGSPSSRTTTLPLLPLPSDDFSSFKSDSSSLDGEASPFSDGDNNSLTGETGEDMILSSSFLF